jgi:oligopeptide/dipeptide ABC transporter ATP-binding protein
VTVEPAGPVAVTPVVELRGLTVTYPSRRGAVVAVDAVDLEVHEGEVLGIVGESGCGKSTLLRAIMGLIAKPGEISAGEIRYRDQDIVRLPSRELRALRGKAISMVFQDPLSALNPAFRVGDQILELLELHGIGAARGWRRHFDRSGRRRQRQRVLQTLEEVGIADPTARFRAFPHQMSGGMQQRALVAMAIVGGGTLLLADEPTTALDVTIQAQIMELLGRINRERHTSIVMVTHDLALASENCDTIAVMYAGRVVEQGPASQVVSDPQHPYTAGLLSCLPQESVGPLRPIPGTVPDMADLPEGCAFAPRCSRAAEVCVVGTPPWAEPEPGRRVLCHFPGARS